MLTVIFLVISRLGLLLFLDLMLLVNLLKVLERPQPQILKRLSILIFVQLLRDVVLRRRVEQIVSDGRTLDLRPLNVPDQLVILYHIVVQHD